MHDICVVGHVTRDVVRRNLRVAETLPGGVAHYAGVALASLGLDTAVVTKLAEGDVGAFLGPLAAAGATVTRHLVTRPFPKIWKIMSKTSKI